MAATRQKNLISSSNSSFSLSGFLIGYLVSGLFIVGIALFIASIQSVQTDMKSMFGFTRGQTLLLSFFVGLIVTAPFAFYFEKKSR